jgi:hypothetical protein
LIQITVFKNPDLISNFLNNWLIAARNIRKFHFCLCLRATVIIDRSLTLTHSDAIVDESDQRKFPNYLLDRLIQRAAKEYWSEKMMLDTERAVLVIYTYRCD